MECGWSLHRQHLGQGAQGLEIRQMRSLRMSHQDSDELNGGWEASRELYCCLKCLKIVLDTWLILNRASKEHSPRPISCIFTFPNIAAPESSNFWTHQLVCPSALVKSFTDPRVFLQPDRSTSSLIATGTPSRIPSGLPSLNRLVDASAAASRCSFRISMKTALYFES